MSSSSNCPSCQSRRQFLSTGLILPDWSFAGSFSHNLQGKVWVNGRLANQKTRIKANSLVTTSSHDTSFVIGNNAFKLRPNSQVQFTPVSTSSRIAISTLRLISGGLLSVFGAIKNSSPLQQPLVFVVQACIWKPLSKAVMYAYVTARLIYRLTINPKKLHLLKPHIMLDNLWLQMAP